MKSFNEFIEFLRENNIKRFDIEFHEPTDKERAVITTPVERMLTAPKEAAGAPATLPAVVLPAAQPAAAEPNPPPAAPPIVPVEEKKPPRKAAKEKAAKPVEETKPESAAAAVKPEDVYATFVQAVTHDDGAVDQLARQALINQMKLDDLLRLNNDFSLGINTDQSTEALRKELADCF